MLIVLGILALVYQGIPTKSERDVIRVGSAQTSIETKRIIVLPPIVGGLVLAAGVVLVAMGFKKKS